MLAKLGRFKKAIDDVGSYKNAAKLLLSRRKRSRKKKAYQRMQKLAAEVIGVVVIQSYCT